MKTIIALLVALNLTACATPPQWLANSYDRNDPCQTGAGSEAERARLNRPQGYSAPNWCGASANRIYIYNNNSIRQGYISK
jgi:hypothetical protein